MRSLLITIALTAALAAAAPCPPDGPVTADIRAVGCADLRLTVISDNITLAIEGATGTINVTSAAAGTTLRLLDSTIAGNLTLSGSHAFADVRRSTITGTDVVVLSGGRNATIAVVDSTLTGVVVASVLSSSFRASITIVNSTLNATRYAASVVGVTIRDVAIVVTASHLALAGGNNVGVVALAADTVVNAEMVATASSITCDAGQNVGILGTGHDSSTTWTNVIVSAADSTVVTSNATKFVGVLGAASNLVSWTNVTVSAALANVTSIAKDYVGILGASSRSRLSWTNVTVSAARANVTSIAGGFVGILGAGSQSRVTWTNVTVSAALATVSSTAGSDVGVLGAGSGADVTWVNVTISAALASVKSTAVSFVGVIGAGCYSGVTWANVTFWAALANVTSTAKAYVGVLGAASTLDSSWTNVTVSVALANVTSTAGSLVGIIGAGCGGAVGWTNVTVSAVLANVTSLSVSNYVGVLGVACFSDVSWRMVTVSVVLANVTCLAGDYEGVLGAGCGGAVTWTNVTVSAVLANVTSTAGNGVGLLGSGSIASVNWTNVAIFVALVNVSSTAHGGVGLLGVGSSAGAVTWTNVTVTAALANVTSTAGSTVGVLGVGSYVSFVAGQTMVSNWTDVAVALADSKLSCHHETVSGVIGAAVATRDALGRPVAYGTVTWRGVVVVAVASVVSVWAGERAAVLGATADGAAWDDVFAGAVEASRLFARVGPVAFTLGAPGVWRDTVLANGSASIDVNSAVLCSNRTVESCAGEIPDHIATLIDRARHLDLCGVVCVAHTQTATESQTSTPTATAARKSETLTATTTSTTMAPSTTTPSVAVVPTTSVTATNVTSTTVTESEHATMTTTATGTTAATASATTTSGTTPASAMTSFVPFSEPAMQLPEPAMQLQQHAVEASAAAASGALGVVASPLAANKGTTMSRIFTNRDCRWAPLEPEPTQFVHVFELGGGAAAGALASTLLLQALVAIAAAACARVRRFSQVFVVHLAVLSYYGPNVAALATAALSGGDGKVVEVAIAGLVLNAGLLGVAVASACVLVAHHRPLWKESRDPLSALVRVYGALDLTCAFFVGALSGLGGLSCATRGALICATCFVNFAHAALVRPAARRLDNALSATTTLLVFALALLSATAPREPTYDRAVLALAAAVAAWMYLLLALALAAGVLRFLRRRGGIV